MIAVSHGVRKKPITGWVLAIFSLRQVFISQPYNRYLDILKTSLDSLLVLGCFQLFFQDYKRSLAWPG
jgi:hypothetical protein